jgi:UDP-glucose 4-epimerase
MGSETSPLNDLRVLVTGGAGFIGSHLVDALVKTGCQVYILDNLSTGRIENIGQHLSNGSLSFLEGDLLDRQTVDEAVKNVNTLFHLAAITSVPYSIRNPNVTREVNLIGTTNLLEASLRYDVKRFIYVSTCAVYGEPKYLPVDEKHPTNPISPYAATKLSAEQSCKKFEEMHGLKTTIVRLFNVYGLRQWKDQYSGVITKFVECLRNGKPPIIYGDGEQTRDFINVKDVVEAFILILERGEAAGRTFNIATGKPTSINQLVQLIIEISGVEGVKPQYQAARQGDINHSYADISEAKNTLGYEQKVPLKKGLSSLITSFDNRIK